MEADKGNSVLLETHPWKYYVPEGCKALVIGTFPPAKRNWAFDFFYPNKRNRFWNIMEVLSGKRIVFHEGEDAVNERKKLLDELKVGVTDMGNEVYRLNDSSLDEKLSAKTYMAIHEILQQHSTIERLLFTSSSGPVSAWKWFTKYLVEQGVTTQFIVNRKPWFSEVTLYEKKITLVIAYSPSPRASNRMKIEDLAEMYRLALFGTPSI